MRFKFPKISLRKSKKKMREEMLLKDYEEGKVLQIDNQKDNKEYFQKIKDDRLNKN
jgi:hypothetical protein